MELKRSPPNIDIVSAVTGPPESFYRKFDIFCANNGLDSCFYHTSELPVIRGLYDLAEKIGVYQRRMTRVGNEYLVVDLSWPVIKGYGLKVVAEHPQKTDLAELLNRIAEISHEPGNCAVTHMTNLQHGFILDKILDFLDPTGLPPWARTNLIAILSMLIRNYSGFQRVASLLVVSFLNRYDDGFSPGFTRIKVVTTQFNFSYVDYTDRTMGLRADLLRSRRSIAEAARACMHELSHVFHYMVCGGRSFFYRNAIEYVTYGILANDSWLRMYFPMLENFDTRRNAVLKEILQVIPEDKFAAIKGKVVKLSQRQPSRSTEALALFNTIEALVRNGFGRIIFGHSWTDSLASTLTMESLAKILYLRTLLFSTRNDNCWIDKSMERFRLSPGHSLHSNWLDLEEILTIFGIVLFVFKGQCIALEDKQNEQMFSLRRLQFNPLSEQDAGVFKMHALPFTRRGANTFMSSTTNYLLQLQGRHTFFPDDGSYQQLFYPRRFVHAKYARPETTITPRSTNDPLRDLVSSEAGLDYLLGNGPDSLYLAVCLGLIGKITHLIGLYPQWLRERFDDTHDSLLHAAVKKEQLIALTALLQHITPNVRNDEGRYPLHYAILTKNERIIEILLSDHRTYLTKKDHFGDTPLQLAEKEGPPKLANAIRRAQDRKFQFFPPN
ncbi:MAG: ankyrin repeat domain-containing protein [Holosporales bacterium]|jgi:hypothetical protein|nr:ankyrin repeat domain-containing protein [Holosporales bacterium]